jgi:hypothetical protein
LREEKTKNQAKNRWCWCVIQSGIHVWK